MTDYRAQASILSFRAGELLADFAEGVKKPGIYGKIMNPIELLDTLTIKDGTNVTTVRFAAQFIWNQTEINKKIRDGMRIGLSENLELYWIFQT